MAERSAAALHWLAVSLVLWGLTRLIPPTGNRRKPPTTAPTIVTSKNTRGLAGPAVRVPPVRRSPYSTDRAPLDGSASRLSRPYLPAHMDAPPTAGRLRRRAITMPAVDFGIDVDTRDIHAEPSEAVTAR